MKVVFGTNYHQEQEAILQGHAVFRMLDNCRTLVTVGGLTMMFLRSLRGDGWKLSTVKRHGIEVDNDRNALWLSEELAMLPDSDDLLHHLELYLDNYTPRHTREDYKASVRRGRFFGHNYGCNGHLRLLP